MVRISVPVGAPIIVLRFVVQPVAIGILVGGDRLAGLDVIHPAAAADEETKHRLELVVRLGLLEVAGQVAYQGAPLAVFEMAAQAVMDIGLGAEIVGVHRGVIEVAEAVLGLHCDIDGEGCAVLCTSCSIPSP